jgi:hypothetical protein
MVIDILTNTANALDKSAILPIDHSDIPIIEEIVRKILVASEACGLPADKIVVVSERFLPHDFDATMRNSYNTFTDSDVSWKDALPDMWEVAKCDKIVRDRRRRMLFKRIPPAALEHYTPAFENMATTFIEFLQERFANHAADIHCHETLRLPNGIMGQTDIRIGDTLIEIKCSNDISIKVEWILQILAYVALCSKHGIHIQTIAIFNPLKGFWCEQDIGAWQQEYADEYMAFIQTSMQIDKIA